MTMIEAFRPTLPASRRSQIMLFPRLTFRKIALAGGGTLLLFVGAWFFMVLTKDSAPKLTRDNIRKIRAGMNQVEIEAIVGARPTFHSEESDSDVRPGQVKWTKADGWVGDEAELTVMYDEDGKVVR